MKNLLIASAILLAASCANVTYKNAKSEFDKEDYKFAIESFNKFIKTSHKQPLVLKSKLYRSSSYYALGKTNFMKNDYKTAADYLFLANSNKADSLLDECFLELAKISENHSKYEKSITYLDFIINNLNNSNLMPLVLYQKMGIQYENFENSKKSYETYKVLVDKFPNSHHYLKAKKLVNKFMPSFLDEVKVVWKKGIYKIAIDQLLQYGNYPADSKDNINNLIGEVYFSWGKDLLQNEELFTANQRFKTAVKYKIDLENRVHDKLITICEMYIDKGDSLFNRRDIEAAMAEYKTTFDIINAYENGKLKIKRAQQKRKNIERAKVLTQEGDKLFAEREYKQSLSKYNKAYNLDNYSLIAQKIEKTN